LKEIVKAAYDGRVLHLPAAPGAHPVDTFDDVLRQMRVHSEEQPRRSKRCAMAAT
jgi:hypothetical protein